MALVMRQWRSHKMKKGRSLWRVGLDDNSDAPFPEQRRLRSVFKRHSPVAGDLTVEYRGPNCLLIEIPAGLTPANRENFRSAVEAEMTR